MRAFLRFIYRLAAALLSGSNIERLPVIGRVNKIVTGLIRADVIRLHGHTFHLDARDSLNLSILRVFEPEETALLQREVEAGNVAIDLGAHIGYYSILLAELVGETGNVYAFEPAPDNFAILEQNLLENNCTNVTAERKAVSDKTGSSMLHLSASDSADHRLYQDGHARTCVETSVVSLDDYFKGYAEPIDFIKIDIQGAENHALEGMRQLIARSPSLKLLTEFCPEALRHCGVEPVHYLDNLRESGFELFCLDKRTRAWAPADVPSLLERHTVENESFTNLFCVKRGRGKETQHHIRDLDLSMDLDS